MKGILEGALGLIALIVLIAVGPGLYDEVNSTGQWCENAPRPLIERLEVKILDGNRLYVRTTQPGILVTVNHRSYTEGMVLADGRYTVEGQLTEQIKPPFLAGLLGLGPDSCSKTGSAVQNVAVDTTGPQLVSMTTELNGSIAVIRGSVNDAISRKFEVGITGFEPVAFTGNEFTVSVPLEIAEHFEVRLSISDENGNLTESNWFTLPLPENFWGRYSVDGNLVQISLQQPQISSLGLGLDQWQHVVNNHVVETISAPIWVYALITLTLFVGVVIFASRGFILANVKKRQLQQQRMATANAAFHRLTNGTYAWARLQPLKQFEITQILAGDYSFWILNRESRLKRYADDVRTVKAMWPNSDRVKPYVQNAQMLQRWIRTYTKVIELAENRQLTEAWGHALNLPDSVPAFQLLRQAVADQAFGILKDLIDPNASALNPFALDALGITPRRALLDDLVLIQVTGDPLPESTKQEIRDLHALVIKRTKQVGLFGSHWQRLIMRQIDAITMLGAESLANYLIEYASFRIFSDL